MKSSEILSIPLQNKNSPATKFIERMYNSHPKNPFNRREFAMVYGAGDDAQLAFFELETSLKGDNWVHLKFFHTSPHREGVGTKAMQELQREAQKDGINIELVTWDKGKVSASKLEKFYKSVGFMPTTKGRGSKIMTWQSSTNEDKSRDNKEKVDDKEESDTSEIDEIFDKLQDSGYNLIGQGADATVWMKDTDPGVVKIIMPEDGKGAGAGAETFNKFYKFCKNNSALINLPKFISLKKFDLPQELKDKGYIVVGMEKLEEIPNGSFEEAMCWILSDLATKDFKWIQVSKMIRNPKTWEHFDEGMPVEEIINYVNQWSKIDKIRWSVLFALMKVLYQTGKLSKRDWDLHTENVMMRKDGTLVIVDPWLDI